MYFFWLINAIKIDRIKSGKKKKTISTVVDNLKIKKCKEKNNLD